MRLTWLFLRSRVADRALPALIAVAGALWLWERWWRDEPQMLSLGLVVMPAAAAAVVCMTVGSPFGDIERAVSRRLTPLRFGQLAGLLLLGALALLLAAFWEPAGREWLLPRNLAGLAGLGLLASRVAGPLAWLLPIAVGMFSHLATGNLGPLESNWPAQPSDDPSALIIALALAAAGLAVAARWGAREFE